MRKLAEKSKLGISVYTYTSIMLNGVPNVSMISPLGVELSMSQGSEFYKIELNKWCDNIAQQDDWMIKPQLTEDNRLHTTEEVDEYYRTCIL